MLVRLLALQLGAGFGQLDLAALGDVGADAAVADELAALAVHGFAADLDVMDFPFAAEALVDEVFERVKEAL